MAFCTYCGQEFRRNEHLERHLATHSNVKRFKCNICHISFARGDVLQRHLSIHEDGAAAEEPARVRRRTRSACQNCARMKAKCDTGSPCNRCLTKGLRCDRQPRKPQVPAARRSTVAEAIDEDEESHDAEYAENEIMHGPMEITVDGVPEQTMEKNNEARLNDEATSTRPPVINSQTETAFEAHNEIFDSERRNDIDAYTPFLGQNTSKADNLNRVLASSAVNSYGNRGANIGVHTASVGQLPINSLSDWLPDFQDTGIYSQSEPLSLILPDVPEHHTIIEAQEYWSTFCCNPRKSIDSCPRTGGVLIESLRRYPVEDNIWQWPEFDFPSPASPIMPLHESVRDKLSAISQTYLKKAIEVHRLDPAATSSLSDVSEGFLVLPPVATLERFLREYMRLFEPFYTVLPSGFLDGNALMDSDTTSSSTLLILLMIGQGAISDPTSEARRLSGGLTEVCRISLFDTIEKNVSVCHQDMLVHSTLLFIIQAAWSGDKWLMDIGLGQRGIYLSVMRNAGIFLDRSNGDISHPEDGGFDTRYACWIELERHVRLAYTWVILDLEISLFQGVNLILRTSELKLRIPGIEKLFLASDSSEWHSILVGYGKIDHELTNTPSFCTLFGWFLNNNITEERRHYLNLTTLRLLLHPLHAMVQNTREILSCLGLQSSQRTFLPVSRKSTEVRMEEVQSLLQRWLELFNLCFPEPSDERDGNNVNPRVVTVLLTYHVIYLNTVADFAEIEEIARQRLSHAKIRQNFPCSAYVQDCEQALFHAGRIIYLLRCLEQKTCPPWTPAALYRATMILWATSVLYGQSWDQNSSLYVTIDAQGYGDTEYDRVQMFHGNRINASISAWDNNSSKPVPILSGRERNNGPVFINNPTSTVESCLLVFDDGVSTRFSEGIRRKLKQFLDSRYMLENDDI